MAKIPFEITARITKLIGQENFANAEGAIIELVKNTYDADAKNCIVLFENHDPKDKTLYIIDDGEGMTNDVIKEFWMTIGTGNKLYNYESDGGRVKTGAKGIGRFALNRLGKKSKMLTKSKKTDLGCIWDVDWEDFDSPKVLLSDIKADLSDKVKINIKTEINKKIADIISVIPDTFMDDRGTIIKIMDLKDDWDETAINKLFDNLQLLVPPEEQPGFNLFLYSTDSPDEYGKVNSAYYDDFDYKVSSVFNADGKMSLDISIYRNELKLDALETWYSEIFKNELLKMFPFRLKDFKSNEINIHYTKEEIDIINEENEELLKSLGKFEFHFYFLKNQISSTERVKFPYKNIVSANRRAWLDKFGGVKVFRDDFRVRPYGDKGNDWLGLGDRQIQSPGGVGQKLGGYRIRPNQISGIVKISRVDNPLLADKAGREGIQENDAYILFKNFLLSIISVFEKDRNTIMFCLSELDKKRNEREQKKKKARAAAKKGADSSSEETKAIAEGFQILEEELSEKNEELRLLRSLASTGLIISTFSHDLRSLRSKLIPRTDVLINMLKNFIDENTINKLNNFDNPFYQINLMKNDDIKLKHWLDYSLNALKRDKRKRNKVIIGEYFENYKNSWRNALTQRKVKLTLHGNTSELVGIRAFEIDLDSIFNNLLSNSLYFLKKKHESNKCVDISWKQNGEDIEIIFSDNGIGLAKKYYNRPNDVFNVFETSKQDQKGNNTGTGMGLYIVKSIIDEYAGASVDVLNNKKGFTIKIIFKIRNN